MTIEKSINYQFKDKNLLKLALTHSSFCHNDEEEKFFSNQRLEFFGDAVLQLIITEYLYNSYPDLKEGDLTKIRSYLVSQQVFAEISKNLKLSEEMFFSLSAKKMNNHLLDSTLCDGLEALVGAIYLDSNQQITQKIILPLIKPFVKKAFQWREGSPKNIVQEYVQKRYQQLPEYRINKIFGQDHCPYYIIDLYIGNEYKASGEGKNKKDAQQQAAQKFLNLFIKDYD